MHARMRRLVTALLLPAVLGCAGGRLAAPPDATPPGEGSVLRAAELARVRCLLVAPFENGSDAPLAAETATGAVLSGVDPARTRVFPVAELRGLFRDTPLELPQGIPPSLALELAELVGADAALWGSVAGRSSAPAPQDAPELAVGVNLSLVGDRSLLFADTALVRVAPGERPETAIRRAVRELAQPMLARLGDPGQKKCFDAERSRTLRKFAVAEEHAARGLAAGVTERHAGAAAPAAPGKAPPPAQKTEPRTPRQTEWARRLAEGGRVLVEDVSFEGRSATFLRDSGLADLAVALLARPAIAVRIEGFVDATSDRAGDQKLSGAMVQAAARRLAELGVSRQRITLAGRGGESPLLPNFTARGRAANRRLEVVAVP